MHEDNLKEARKYYTEALNHLENDAEKDRIEYILNDIKTSLEMANLGWFIPVLVIFGDITLKYQRQH